MKDSVVQERDIPVPRGKVFEAITRFERYPEFLPEVVSAKIISGEGTNLVRVHFELEVIKRFVYELEFALSPPGEITWKLVESDFFKENEGKWLLEEKSPEKTHVRYELKVGFGFFVPGFVAKQLTVVALPKMLENFEGEAARVWKGE